MSAFGRVVEVPGGGFEWTEWLARACYEREHPVAVPDQRERPKRHGDALLAAFELVEHPLMIRFAEHHMTYRIGADVAAGDFPAIVYKVTCACGWTRTYTEFELDRHGEDAFVECMAHLADNGVRLARSAIRPASTSELSHGLADAGDGPRR